MTTGWIADRDQLERGFRGLDPDQRAVLVLHYYVGMSVPMVAETLGVPLGPRNRASGARSRPFGPRSDLSRHGERAPPARRDRMNGTDRLERELTRGSPTRRPRGCPTAPRTSLGRHRPSASGRAGRSRHAGFPRLSFRGCRGWLWSRFRGGRSQSSRLLGLLLAAAIALYVGSPRGSRHRSDRRLNGLVAYAEDGDIWTVDPITGVRQKRSCPCPATRLRPAFPGTAPTSLLRASGR